MKLLYLANLRLPTEKAYGIQIAKMCELFTLQHNTNLRMYANATNEEKIEVELAAPFRINKIKEDFFEYYDIKRIFRFRVLWVPDFYLPGKLDRISFYIKNLISALVLIVYALNCKPDVIYSRDELIVFLLSFFKKNIVSKALKNEFTRIGFSDDNILVAPDGVDIERFDLSISKEEARERVGFPLDKKIVMYAGHLFEWKGAGVLLEAARKFQVSSFKFQVLFVFIGGTEQDIAKFRKKAEGLNNVLILGHKPHKDIPMYLKAADALVLPNSANDQISKYTSPLKMFEYMASKRPIVASDLPSIREVLNDSNSVLAKADSTEALVSSFNRLLNDLGTSLQLAEKAFQDVQQYTWQKRAEKIAAIFKSPSI